MVTKKIKIKFIEKFVTYKQVEKKYSNQLKNKGFQPMASQEITKISTL